MPFFPALPEPRPATAHPFSALMGGMGAATEMKRASAEAALKREALLRSQKERQAVEQFQKTGDPNVLTSVMTPQQAMVAKEAHTQQQIQTGLAISQYFDQIKPDLTWENYPKARADAIRQFPALGEQMFPPPEALGNKENFDKWKWSKFEKLAEFKARPQVITAQSRLDAAKIRGEYDLQKTREAGASRERAAETRAVGQIGAAKVRATAPAKAGQITPFKHFITDPEIAALPPAEQVRRYNQSFTESRTTPLQKAKTEQEEVKTRLMKRLAPGGAKEEGKPDEGGPYYLMNKKTGKPEQVTKEQFEQVMGK